VLNAKALTIARIVQCTAVSALNDVVCDHPAVGG
jgi:hypothetical protein